MTEERLRKRPNGRPARAGRDEGGAHEDCGDEQRNQRGCCSGGRLAVLESPGACGAMEQRRRQAGFRSQDKRVEADDRDAAMLDKGEDQVRHKHGDQGLPPTQHNAGEGGHISMHRQEEYRDAHGQHHERAHRSDAQRRTANALKAPVREREKCAAERVGHDYEPGRQHPIGKVNVSHAGSIHKGLPVMRYPRARYWTAPNSPKQITAKGTEYQLWPVSYGPYKVDSWPDAATLVLVKNKDYKPPSHLKGPYYDKIIIKAIPEEASRMVALEKGEVDVIFRPPYVQVKALEKDAAKYSVAYFRTPGLPQGYMPNVTVSPTNEKNVRLALIYALDRNEVSQLAWFGTAKGASSCLASTSWAFWKESADEYKYNPEKAKQLLDEAGWKLDSKTSSTQGLSGMPCTEISGLPGVRRDW